MVIWAAWLNKFKKFIEDIKMFKNNLHILLLGSLLISTFSCKTYQAVQVDKARGELEVFSVADETSAMPDPKKLDTYNDLMKDVKEKKDKATEKDLLNLAQAHLVRGEFDDSEKIVRDVLHKDLKNRDARLILANIFYRRGLHDMSMIILNNLGGNSSKDSRVINLMAMIFLSKNENEKAMAYFKEALKYNSSDVAVRMNLGVLYLKYKLLNEAAVQFERVLSVVPDHQDARMHMATIWANRGQYDEAEKIYKDILSRDNKNQVAMYNYAVLLGEKKEYDDAIEKLKTFIATEKGKSNKTDRAFALIDRLRTRMVAEGEEYSNEEIQALAKAVDGRKVEEVQVAAQVAKPKTTPEVEKKQEIKPEKAEEIKPVSTKNDSVDDLEKMLME